MSLIHVMPQHEHNIVEIRFEDDDNHDDVYMRAKKCDDAKPLGM